MTAFSITQLFHRIFNSSTESIAVNSIGGFAPPKGHDAITVTYPDDTHEVYAYKTGGTGGTTLMTLTVTYVDDTKEQISSVVKT